MPNTLVPILNNESTESPVLKIVFGLEQPLPAGDVVVVTRNNSTTGIEQLRVYDAGQNKYMVRDARAPIAAESADYLVSIKHGEYEVASSNIMINREAPADNAFITGVTFNTPYVGPNIVNRIKQTGIAQPTDAEPNHLAVLLTAPPNNLPTSVTDSHLWRVTINNEDTVAPLKFNLKANLQGMLYSYARIGRIGSKGDSNPESYTDSGIIQANGSVVHDWTSAVNITDTTFGGDWAGKAQALLAGLVNHGICIVVKPGGLWTMDVVFPPHVPASEVPQPTLEVKTYNLNTNLVQETINSTAVRYGA